MNKFKIIKFLKWVSLPLSALIMLASSCSSFDMFYSEFNVISHHNGGSCRKTSVTIPKNVVIRKKFVPAQSFAASSNRYQINLNLDDPIDLNRRMLLNARQKSQPVNSLKVWANGHQVQTFLSSSVMLAKDIPDMVVDLCPYLISGNNKLEIEVQGPEGSSAEVFVDGFMMPIDIPGAVHSQENSWVTPQTKNTVLYPKFLEGMKVRRHPEEVLTDQLVDLSGISLYPLKIFIQKYNIQRISLYFKGTSDEHDQLERQLESDGIESPNRNLIYSFEFEPRDVSSLKQMRSALESMPFIEGVGLSNESDFVLNGN